MAEKVAVTNPPQVIEVVPRRGFTLEHLTLLRLDSPAAYSAALSTSRPASYRRAVSFPPRYQPYPRPVILPRADPLCLFLSRLLEHLYRGTPRWFLTRGNLITSDTIKYPGDEGGTLHERCRRRYELRGVCGKLPRGGTIHNEEDCAPSSNGNF